MMRVRLNSSCYTMLIYLLAAAISVALSYWMSIRDGIVNPDAICYLQSAATIASDGIQAAMKVCSQAAWPFYSFVIYYVATLTKLSYSNTAFILDGAFSVISIWAFISIIRLLGGTQRVLWLAATVILLAHEFNAVREYIIRDHGFWAFYLISIALLLQCAQNPRWFYAVLWSVAAIIATLFRIEGAVFLVLMPLAILCQSQWAYLQRVKVFLQLNILTLLAAIALLSVTNLSRLAEIQFQIVHGVETVIHQFQVSAEALAQHVLNSYSAGEANEILIFMLLSWFVAKIFMNLSPIYSVLSLYAGLDPVRRFTQSARIVLLGYVIINVAVTLVFLLENMFMSKRYLMALSLVLMLWVPFALERLLQLKHKRIFYMVVVMMLLSFTSSVINFGPSKTYLREAGAWLATYAPAQAAIYSNDEAVLYYSRHFGNDIFAKAQEYRNVTAVNEGKWQHYDYVALRINKKDETGFEALSKEIARPPVQAFANKRGDAVLIFKVVD